MDCLGCFDPFQQYVSPTTHPSDIAMMFVCTHLNQSAFTGLHVDWLEAVNIAFAIPTLNDEVSATLQLSVDLHAALWLCASVALCFCDTVLLWHWRRCLCTH